MAANAGEKAKLTRYGPDVIPTSVETYGRMGRKSFAELQQLCMNICSGSHQGGFHNGAQMLSIMRAEIEKALLYNIADITLLSLGHRTVMHQHAPTSSQSELP